MTISLTVAIPTHNRARVLPQTLASAAALEIPPHVDAEILVVDNNSTDDTAAVAGDFASAARLPTRCVFESGAGSSFARNRAVAESRADFIFFIDDDAVAEPAWATELLAEIERRGLDAACGMVLPRWEAQPPGWLEPRLWVKLAVHDERAIAAPAERLDNYFSANAGFRRATFERFGGFREDLGVVGGNPISGEDTELFARIIAGGGRMGFASRARVHHLVPRERMTREYLRRKSFAYGVGSAMAGGRSHNGAGKLAKNLLRMAAAAARGDAAGVVYHQLECANFFGYWRGRMMQKRARRTAIQRDARTGA